MKIITLYNSQELKESFPDAYQRAYEDYRDNIDFIHWQEEILDSLKAVFEYSDILLRNWEIGAYHYSFVDYDLSDEVCNLSGARAFAWLENNLFSNLRISWYGEERKRLRKYGKYYYPSRIKPCPFTGACFDEDFLDSLRNDIKHGGTIEDAYHNLARTAQRLMEAELEGQQSEEYFLDFAWANEFCYTEDGVQV